MEADLIDIHYHFTQPDAPQNGLSFQVRLHPDSLLHVASHEQHPPDWTRLEVAQCAHCPIRNHHHTHCPAAVSVVGLVQQFNTLLSFKEVDVVVTTSERTVTQRTSVQKGLSSLFGLYMATSACPSFDLLRPMARFHLPFATREETLYRAVSTYLLGQYFLHQEGQAADLNLEQLALAYEQIHEVNMSMAKRLRTIAEGDAHLNAVVLLDLLAHQFPTAIDLRLSSLRPYFAPYLSNAPQKSPGAPS